MPQKKSTIGSGLAVVGLAAAGINLNLRAAASQDNLDIQLVQAARSGNYRAVKNLLQHHADPNSRYPMNSMQRLWDWLEGYPQGEPLDTTALVEAAAQGRTDIVRLLLEHGADVNIRCRYDAPTLEGYDPKRYTALQLAKMGRYTDTVRLLVQAGAKE